MRARIAASGLCHAKGFADQVETAYRQMWRRWCQARSHNLTPKLTRRGGQVEQQV
jgi:hypothetical protein